MSNPNYNFDIKYPHNNEDRIEEVLEYTSLVPFVDENNVVTHYYNPSNNNILTSAQNDITNKVFLGPSEFNNEKEVIVDPSSITINNLNDTLEENIDPLFSNIDLQLDPNMDIPTEYVKPEPTNYNQNYNNKILLSVFGLIFLVSLIFLIYKACDSGLLATAKKDMSKGFSKLIKRVKK